MNFSPTEIRQAISAVDWSRYETAYGNAAQVTPSVEQSLLDLFFGGREAALSASHALWCGLCHQHAFVSSAALPACDILLYALQILDDEIKAEILDILYGFAACAARDGGEDWQHDLLEKLLARREDFRALAGHPNEDISAFAQLILEALA